MTTIKIHNIETDEIIERNMTADELTRWQKDTEIAEAEKIAKAQAAAAKAALLEKLGITEDEAKLLLS
jgi:arsenate reductase-like glutaredoxin family protein